MITIFLRTILVFILLLVAVRLMGKREIGQLQPFELVVIIIIADVASSPMENINIPLFQGIIPIMALLVSQLTFSYLNIKIPLFNNIFTGKPAILISKGMIQEENLKKQRYTIEELLEQIRVIGYSSFKDIDYAILETSGELSVIPKANCCNVTLKDLNLKASYRGYPRIVIQEGIINEANLKALNKDKKWLSKKIKEMKISIENVLIMTLAEDDEIFYQEKKVIK